MIPEYNGRNLYLGYCASCHGANGAGDGPVAPALALTVPDLRQIKAANGGVFPRETVRDIVDGRALRPVHGTQDMPVWGMQFLVVEESDAYVQARINALTDYLAGIQN